MQDSENLRHIRKCKRSLRNLTNILYESIFESTTFFFPLFQLYFQICFYKHIGKEMGNMKENYEVILEHDNFKQRVATFITKKLAQEFMDKEYLSIENWFENVELRRYYYPSTREIVYESTDIRSNGEPMTILMVRKLTK